MDRDKLFPHSTFLPFQGLGSSSNNVFMSLGLGFQNGASGSGGVPNVASSAAANNGNTTATWSDGNSLANAWMDPVKMLPMYNFLGGMASTQKILEQQNTSSLLLSQQQPPTSHQPPIHNPAMHNVQQQPHRVSPHVNSQHSSNPTTPSGRLTNPPGSQHSASPATPDQSMMHPQNQGFEVPSRLAHPVPSRSSHYVPNPAPSPLRHPPPFTAPSTTTAPLIHLPPPEPEHPQEPVRPMPIHPNQHMKSLHPPQRPMVSQISPGRPSTSRAAQEKDFEMDDGMKLLDDTLNLDIGFNIFASMSQKDQEDIMKADFNFDFTEPMSAAPPMTPLSQGPKQPEKQKEVENAESKLERLLFSMRSGPAVSSGSKNTLTAGGARPAALAATTVTPKAKTPEAQFTPPDSPSGPSTSAAHKESTQPSTSKSIFKASPRKDMSPAFLTPMPKPTTSIFRPRPSFARSANIVPIWKLKATDSETTKELPKEDKGEKSKEGGDAFTFTDDEEEVVEKKTEDLDREEEEKEKDKAVPIVSAPLPKYIPGVGFEVKEAEKEDKPKRGESRRPIPVFGAHNKLQRTEAVEMIEAIRRRILNRTSKDLVQTIQLNDIDCAKEDKPIDLTDADKPPLPRILIRLPKRTVEDHSKKRRRRKRDDDSDDEWYGSDRRTKKKRGRKPKSEKHPDETYSVRLVDPSTIEPHPREPVNANVEYFSKKHRYLRHWKDRENANAEETGTMNPSGVGSEGKVDLKPLSKIISEFKCANARARLSKFKPCVGFVPKGTFMVVKEDIFKSDCALWRVDNMNLLQKFPGVKDEASDKILYKNSSTYSGWCEQIASSYIIVEVSHHRNTRSEAIVEPEVPIADLFPAMTEESHEIFTGVNRKPLLAKDDPQGQADARAFIVQDPLRNALFLYVRSMLEGAVTFDFFKKRTTEQGLIDFNHMNAMSEMEKMVEECFGKIRSRVKWNNKHFTILEKYSSVTSTESDARTLSCQACGQSPVERTILLFHCADYDPGTMQPREETKREMKADEAQDYVNGEGREEDDPRQFLPASEALVCGHCSKYSVWQHRMLHYKFELMSKMEYRMAEIACEMATFTPEQVVDQLRLNYIWLKDLIVDITDFWKLVLSD